ncbi:MAG TPA: tetratricopeptide repeat protein [Rhizomicrobium sp.]|nr:tetratricopeptide repeat protein [Rhizomicrobium sp.]
MLRVRSLVFVAALALMAPAMHAANSAYDQASQLEIDAFDLQAKGDLDGALAKHREAVKIYPSSKAFKQNFAELLNNVGVTKFQAKDYAGAIALFQEALDNVPDFGRAKANLALAKAELANTAGMALFKNGDFAGAIAKFNEALAADPNYKNALVNRDAAEGEVAMKAEDFTTAVAKFQEAVSITPVKFLQDKLTEAQADLAAQQAKAAEEQKKNQK